MPDTSYPMRCLLVGAVSRPAQAGRYARRGHAAEPAEAPEDDKLSIDNQLAAGRQRVADHAAQGWTIAGEVVIPGHSRNYTDLQELCADCPEYADLVARIRAHRCDLVIVAKTDRLWRTMELGLQVQTLLWRHRVQLGDCSHWEEPLPPDQIRRPKALDKFRGLIEIFADEVDNEKRQSNVRPNQLSRITERGLPIARCHYGYRNVGRGVPEVQVPEQVRWLRWMRERRVNDLWGYGRIVRRLEEMGVPSPEGRHWSRAQVRALLTNPYYAGELHWGPAEGQGAHEPVWAPDEWAELQAVNRRMAGDHAPQRVERELTGLCKCAVCRWRLTYHVRRDGRDTLRCSYERNGRVDRPHKLTVFVDEARAQIIARIQAELADPEAWVSMRRQEAVRRQGQDMEAIEAEIRERRQQIERWNDAYERGVIDAGELRGHRTRLRAALDALECERQQAEQWQLAQTSLEARLSGVASSRHELQTLLASLPTLPWQDRRRFWLHVMEAAWFDLAGELVDIDWRL